MVITYYTMDFMSERYVSVTFVDSDVFAAFCMFTVTSRKLYNTKILVTTAVVPHKFYKPGMRHERFQKIKKKKVDYLY
jgi:hypothetical protein